MPQIQAKLALENGLVFHGTSFGAAAEAHGEVCFNTSMTGYQEILTDPSYRGQIVAMTYPHIGNYGVNAEDVESSRPWMSGFVVREISRIASNFRSRGLLEDYLAEHNVPGIADIDTRRLTRVIRSAGAMRGVLSSTDLDDMSLVRKAQASPGLLGRDLVREVVAPDVREWTNPLSPWTMLAPTNERVVSIDAHIVALDFGMKWNICRHLAHLGARVTVMPGTSRAHEVMRHDPAGVFLSNGPGDPEPLQYAIECVRELLPQVPIFGICLGHQILALACGAKTFKLKFGHRGANQPVMNLETKQVEITSQNHGFSVEESTLPSELVVTHRNLNDGTVAGVRHLRYPAFSVQYHPEASAGPHDSHYHFRRFAELLGGRCLVG